ncbi:MAG: secretin N-terminal domain-containing protein [Planctomycetaceae bacterium]
MPGVPIPIPNAGSLPSARLMAPQPLNGPALPVPGSFQEGGVMIPPPTSSAPMVATTDDAQPWTFNFQQAPWTTVIRSFCDSSGYSLQLIAEPVGTFSYYDSRSYNTTEAIDVFNDHLMVNGFILVREGRRLTLTNATSEIPGNLIPFVTIHQLDGLGRNELASVAIPLKNTDTAQAVEEIRQLQSSIGQVKALTNSGRVIVTDTGSYLRRMRDLLLGSGIAAGDEHASVYQLRHAQAEDVAKAITEFLNSAGTTGGVGPDGAPIMSSGGMNPGQRVVAEKTTNSLLVRGTTEEMSTIQQLITDLDRAPREVLVQALLVEVELGNTNELGVELGFQDSVLFDRSVVDKLVTISQTTTAPNGTQTTNQQIISQTAAPGFNFNNQPLGNNIAANPSKVGSQGLSNFGVGRVNGDLGFGGLVLSAGSESVNVLLRALDAQFNIDVLSRPQVRAIENKEAFIQIGQQVPVVDGVAMTPVGSANPVIRQDQAGIILKVTPRISPDGRVQLDVNAEKSAFNLTPGTGVPIFTDATNGNVIEAPIKDVTTADTTVSVQSGQTIVLGGMITNDQMVVTRKVPWLGDIPILGRLFRYDLDRHKRKELLVFLTPIMLEDDAHAEFLKTREVEKIHMPGEAFSFGDNLTGTYSTTADSVMVPATLSGPQASRQSSSKLPIRLAGHSTSLSSPMASESSGRQVESSRMSRSGSDAGIGGWSAGRSQNAASTQLPTPPAAPRKVRTWPLKAGIPWLKKKPDVSPQDLNPMPAAPRPELSPEVLRQQQQQQRRAGRR